MNDVIVTGGFGFIGSNVVKTLNARGIVPYVIDNWTNGDKWRNIRGLRFNRIDESEIVYLFEKDPVTVIALGASVDTKEAMSEDLWKNNVVSLLRLWYRTEATGGRFVYASSGATYGAEEKDFRERLDLVPMCPYAATKLYLDQWFFGGETPAPRTYGLRFFNVYGPREVHKGDMASLVTKGLLKKEPLYQGKKESRTLKWRSDGVLDISPSNETPHWSLFKSPVEEPIQRDFIFSEDVADIVLHFALTDKVTEGIYNVGTGTARSFEDLVRAVDPTLSIKYTSIPDALVKQYQRKTCADITKLRAAGYDKPFTSLEEGVAKTRAWMEEEGLV